jgi:putative sugar O-methyltransferase
MMERMDPTLLSHMEAELASSARFRPSAFWQDVNRKNLAMLDALGLENFKRTVSQNYYNWTISVRSPMLRNALKQWARSPKLGDLIFSVEPGLALQTLNSKMEHLPWHRRQAYGLFVALLWSIADQADKRNLVGRLSEPETGNPLRVWKDGKVISQDLANSIVECNLIEDLLTDEDSKAQIKYAEIGAGYGRLAYVVSMLNTPPRRTYAIFDIPPALCISEWYLRRALPDKRIFGFRRFTNFSDIEEELKGADVAFFTANQIEMFPSGYFDVVLSISTLPEMTVDQVNAYLRDFQRLSSRYIFLKQWKTWKNPLDGTDLSIDDYRLMPNWKVVLDKGDQIVPMFFNRAWKT